jgi:IclR family transcriptional regulator, acetate operon repressor
MATDGTLAKGFILLDVLVDHPQGVTVTGLSREVDLPPSTVHRLLTEMVRIGLARIDPQSRRYQLGMKLFELHHRASEVRTLPEVMLSVMRRLADSTGRTIFIGAREGAEYYYVERLGGSDRVQIRAYVGERLPLHAAAGGKCLLAFLPAAEQEEIIRQLHWEKLTPNTHIDEEGFRRELRQVAECGYAVNDGEIQRGIRAVSVPIMKGARPAYALTVSAPDFRMPLDEIATFLPQLRDAAQEIALQLPRDEDLSVRSA